MTIALNVASHPGAARDNDLEQLRAIYNARVTNVVRCHDDLMLLRVRPDRGIPPFAAGQYTVLGLGYWEPRVAGVQEEHIADADRGKLIKRAYSIYARSPSALSTASGHDRAAGASRLPDRSASRAGYDSLREVLVKQRCKAMILQTKYVLASYSASTFRNGAMRS